MESNVVILIAAIVIAVLFIGFAIFGTTKSANALDDQIDAADGAQGTITGAVAELAG